MLNLTETPENVEILNALRPKVISTMADIILRSNLTDRSFIVKRLLAYGFTGYVVNECVDDAIERAKWRRGTRR